MRKLLTNLAGVTAGLLFAVTAAYAISGGPQYPADNSLNGSYAGVLLPMSGPTATPVGSVTPTPTPSVSPNDSKNSLGIFQFTVVPQNGVALGGFLLFSHGRVYPGTVQGEVDSTRASVRAILQGSNTFTPSPTPTPSQTPPAPTPSPFPTPVTERVNGTMSAHATRLLDSRFTSSGVQLRGGATLNFNFGETDASTEPVIIRTESFKVRGFKQLVPSTTSSATATPTPTATP